MLIYNISIVNSFYKIILDKKMVDKTKKTRNNRLYLVLSFILVLGIIGSMIPLNDNKVELEQTNVFHELIIPTAEYGWVKEVGVFGEEGIEVYYEIYEGDN